jgi:two-component system OmpR family response regulator
MRELILIVDDSPKLLTGMKLRLEMVGYQILVAADGREALELLKTITPHLIVADVMMPRMNGWEFFERVRSDPRLMAIPFVFVTARTDDESIQRGKGLGAEDYLVKPFKAEELEATIRGRLLRSAQLSRGLKSRENQTEIKSVKISDLTIDFKAHRIFKGNEEINLSPTEFVLLANLGQKAGQVLSFNELAILCFPNGQENWQAEDTIRVHIKNIRKKLEADPSKPHYIVNVRGVGYRFEALHA